MGFLPDRDVLSQKVDLNELFAQPIASVVRRYEPSEAGVAAGLVGLPGGLRMAVSAARSSGSAAAPALAPEDQSFLELFDLVESFAAMSGDWDGAGAAAPNETARFRAKRVLTYLMKANLMPDDLSPSVDDGIGFAFRGRKAVDIECSNDGLVMVVVSDGKHEPDVWTVDMEKLEEAVDRIRGDLTA